MGCSCAIVGWDAAAQGLGELNREGSGIRESLRKPVLYISECLPIMIQIRYDIPDRNCCRDVGLRTYWILVTPPQDP